MCVKSCPTLKTKSTVFSKVYFLQNLDTNYFFLYLHSLIICEKIGRKNRSIVKHSTTSL